MNDELCPRCGAYWRPCCETPAPLIQTELTADQVEELRAFVPASHISGPVVSPYPDNMGNY